MMTQVMEICGRSGTPIEFLALTRCLVGTHSAARGAFSILCLGGAILDRTANKEPVDTTLRKHVGAPDRRRAG